MVAGLLVQPREIEVHVGDARVEPHRFQILRNRVRRRLRHLAAAELTRTPPGVCLVLRALPRAASQPAEVPTDLANAWPKALARLAGAR